MAKWDFSITDGYPNTKVVQVAALIIIFTTTAVFSATASASNTSPSAVTLAATTGTFSNEAYYSSDYSAYNDAKVTFGNPNVVSFADLKSQQTPVKIDTGSFSSSTPISSLDFGTNEIWYNGGFGAQDLTTNQTYPSVENLTKTLGVSIIRFPGGIPSDTYHWQTAIGPQTQRQKNVVYQSQQVFYPSTFGPDEFGQFLQKTGAAGDITVNFGTGTAQEAADWVQYMTAPAVGNYWGALRTKNGHPAPYSIPYWEVGNEQQSQSQEYYWRSGSLVSLGDNGQCTSSNIHLCEYVYGGVTKFSNQKTIAPTNISTGNGNPDQTFYAEYPPIVPNSQTVYVNGAAWTSVSSLADVVGAKNDYQLNTASGAITFGNGTHGAVLPAGAVVTISYNSGPHGGFLRYYGLMKAADPKAQICSSFDSTDFIQLMGSKLSYDCLTLHLYGQAVSPLGDTTLFHNILMNQSYDLSNDIITQQADINKYAGARAKNITLAVTEYGVNALTSPAGQLDYHRSQEIALFDANLLRIIITNHIPIAEKHFLISYENSSPPGIQTYINSTTFANNALIGGPGPNVVAQPSAYGLQAYAKLLYPNLISSSITNNPSVIYSGGNYPSLSTLATTDKKGNESILVINLSLTNNILAEIVPSLDNYNYVRAWTLGSNSSLAYNTLSDPQAIYPISRSRTLLNGKVFAKFPAGSITVLQLSR